MLRPELSAELEQLVAEAAVCRANLGEIARVVSWRRLSVTPTDIVAASAEAEAPRATSAGESWPAWDANHK